MDPSAQARSRVGQVVDGKYSLLRLLGAGGMGAVYEAEHALTQRRVALKLMHPNVARSSVAAERFVREARAPGSIGHPGIIDVLDAGRTDQGELYLVMELLEGETLADAMRAGRLPLQEIAAIALELLDVLAAAHDAGFVHRDVKPENVFLALTDEEDVVQVKLLDFGVAGVLEGAALEGEAKLTRAGAVLGTPLYMSPEQALGRKIDARSDLWSVGALLYQALAGQPPYGGASFQELVVSISTRDHVPLGALRPDLPPRAETAIERALRKDPEKRWQSASEMSQALAAAVEGRSTRKDPATLPFEHSADSLPHTARASSEPAIPRWAIWTGLGLIAVAASAVTASVLTAPRPSAPREDPELAAQKDEPELAQAPLPAAQEQTPMGVAVQAVQDESEPVPAAEPPAAIAIAASAAEPPSEPARPTAPTQTAVPRTLGADALAAGFSGKRAELERCYQQIMVEALTRGEAPTGPISLHIDLQITPQGAVERAEVSGQAPPELAECVSERARELRFAAADSPTRAQFPIVFQGSVIHP